VKNLACLVLLLSAGVASADVVLESDAITVTIDATGQVSGLMDKINQVQYAAPGQASPLLLIYREGEFRSPETVAWDDEGKQIVLRYAETRVVVAMESKGTHITLEIVEVTPREGIERSLANARRVH
jgi:hypothetical protein